MKSRYSAYAAGVSDYIIKTTHPDNPDFTEDTKAWKASIETFSRTTRFVSLEIVAFEEGEREAFVTFVAHFADGVLRERSTFRKVGARWLYHSGEIEA